MLSLGVQLPVLRDARDSRVIPFSDLTSSVNHYDMTYLLLNRAWIVCYSLVQGRHLTLRSVQPLLCVWIPLISLAQGICGRALEVPFSIWMLLWIRDCQPQGGSDTSQIRNKTKPTSVSVEQFKASLQVADLFMCCWLTVSELISDELIFIPSFSITEINQTPSLENIHPNLI